MSIPIVWSDTAELTFDAIVTYLENSWGETSARRFVRRASQLLRNLSQQLGFITPQVSVVYKIHPEHIYILYFWDNRQQPIS